MSQRTWAGLTALVLLTVMWLAALAVPLPYVTYAPGPTYDILSSRDGQERVRVTGREAYHDEGELRLTTIYVDQPQDRIGLLRLVSAYLDPDEAVYPYSAVYAPDETDESNDVESAVQMVSSQDAAVAAAMGQLDLDVTEVVEVLHVVPDLPADGKLEVRDQLVRVGDTDITTAQDVVTAVDAAPAGQPLVFVVRRDGEELTVEVTPRTVDGDKRVGITPGPGFDFPFEVSVDIDSAVGGPSAGLMFALAIYDTLTPGSLTGEGAVAGTGTVDAEGTVGRIGGVQQKIAGARDAGAELFLVPAGNCPDVGGVDPEDMRLTAAATLEDAVRSVQAWAEDPDADLPTCEDVT